MRKLTLIVFAVVTATLQGQAVTGTGNFSHIVANLDKSLEFYRDVLGLEVSTPPGAFSPNPAIMKLGDTIGGQSRMAQLKVPGSAIGVEIIEYKDIDRKPAHPRFQDPGAANLSLRVRDLNAVAARAKKAGVHVLTLGGAPVTVLGGLSMFMQDDDGFVVELSQADTPGGGFETTAADVEKTVAAYRAFGLEPAAAGTFDDFNSTKALTDNAGTPGAAFRERRMPIKSAGSGPMASINFIEFKNIERKPLHTRVQDPGTAILQLNVTGLDALLPKLKAAGFAPVSTGGVPVDLGGARIVIVRDLNNLFLELIERKGQ